MAVVFSCLILLGFLVGSSQAISQEDVVYAINAGGPKVVDTLGIHYREDQGQDRPGTVSDYGLRLTINGIPDKDMPLYQTERYHDDTFGYTLPTLKDGDYVLVSKFSEVYFEAAGEKVFHITLGGVVVVGELDIFETVGKGHGHDEIVSFTISENGGILTAGSKRTPITQPIMVEFLKTDRDNPKVCALYVARGTEEDLNIPLPLSPEMYEMEDISEGSLEGNDIEDEEGIIPEVVEQENEEEEEQEEMKRNVYDRRDPVKQQAELGFNSVAIGLLVIVGLLIGGIKILPTGGEVKIEIKSQTKPERKKRR